MTSPVQRDASTGRDAARSLTTRAYWVVSPGRGELRDEQVPALPAPGRSLVRTRFTAVSPGTERLVGNGLVQGSDAGSMACRSMAGSFLLPIKYGYSLVGAAIAGALVGRRLFVMHPHQSLADVADQEAVLLPDAVPDARATLIPNLETAWNACWDAEPVRGARAVVVGGGIVGALIAYVLARVRGSASAIVEIDAERRARLADLPWIDVAAAPGELEPGRFDVAFHTSGNPAGLDTALRLVGFEGRVLELSWYGTRRVEVDLGTHFHVGRKSIVASQVGAVARARRATHGPRERLAEVLALLDDAALDALVSAPLPFASMPERLAPLYRGTSPWPMPLFDHSSEHDPCSP